MLRRALWRSTPQLPGGMGGIVFFAKNGEADEWAEVCQRLGRGEDVIRITPGGRYGFNFMDFISSWGEGGERGPIPAVALLEEIASVLSPESAGGAKGENAFFYTALRIKMTQLVLLAQLARLPVSLALMNAISSSAPQTPAQGNDPAWREGSICWHALREAEAHTRGNAAAAKDFVEVERYFMQLYAGLDNRPKSSVEIMWTQLVTPFLSRPLRPLLCEQTNITPEMCFEQGKIFLVDVPVQEYGLTAKLCAVAFKRCFQLAVMRRAGPPGALRPVFWFADEAQNLLSPKDTEYQAVARSAGGVTVLLTQQISSVREALGHPDKAENLTSNLQTVFVCQSTGETARWASQRIGERYVKITGFSGGHSAPVDLQPGVGSSTNSGISVNEQLRSYIQPSAFQRLRRGGAANNYIVEAVVFAGGKMFAGDKANEPQPYKTLAFNQR
jgi:hypothetical protein